MAPLPPSPGSAAERGQAALRLASEMLTFFDAQAARAAPMTQATDGTIVPIACKTGCSYCCRMEVSISNSEALLLLSAVQAQPEEMQQRLRARIDALAPRLRGVNAETRRRLNEPCPLLNDDGACSVYDARPLGCRSHVSFDMAACVADVENLDAPVPIPTSRTLTQQRDAIRPRHRELESAIGLAAGRYELVQALRILLTRPDAAGRIARGEDVLRPTRIG